MPSTDVGGCFSHFSHACRVCSRPTEPQLTNAPANFAAFGSSLEAALVTPSAATSPLKAIAARMIEKARIMRRRRSVRSITCPREFSDKQRRKPSPNLDRALRCQMAGIELDRHVALHELIAASVAANRIIDRQVGRAVGGDHPAHLLIPFPHPGPAH